MKTKDFVLTGKIDHLVWLLDQIKNQFGKNARLGDVLKQIKVNR